MNTALFAPWNKNKSTWLKFKVGQKIKFFGKGEKIKYTVRACNNRYVILTKPFNPKRTVLYTIIDQLRNIRGTENLVFGLGFETDELCNEALIRLQIDESEVSSRNFLPLSECFDINDNLFLLEN